MRLLFRLIRTLVLKSKRGQGAENVGKRIVWGCFAAIRTPQPLRGIRVPPKTMPTSKLKQRLNFPVEALSPYKLDKCSIKTRSNGNDGYSANRLHPRSRRLGSRPPVPYLLPYANDRKRSRTNGYSNKAACWLTLAARAGRLHRQFYPGILVQKPHDSRPL